MTVSNALTFDLEHWYSATLLRDGVRDPPDLLSESVRTVLRLLERTDTVATFFTVGRVAESHPDLVCRIRDEGHEIGSHGHTHTPLTELDRDGFRRELAQSTDAITDATGEHPRGFRAPNFSISTETAWAFECIDSAGFDYDSSVFPTWTPMYGVPNAPCRPYSVGVDDPFTSTSDTLCDGLLEFPLTVHPWLRFPIAGGFYARCLPVRVLRHGIQKLNRRGVPGMLYFHPWEFNPAVKDALDGSDVSFQNRFISTVGSGSLEDKVESLLTAERFDTATAVISEVA